MYYVSIDIFIIFMLASYIHIFSLKYSVLSLHVCPYMIFVHCCIIIITIIY